MGGEEEGVEEGKELGGWWSVIKGRRDEDGMKLMEGFVYVLEEVVGVGGE